jgi:hypothetical protein
VLERGKTVAALHRLKIISEAKKSDEKILFTTYTKALTENLSTLIEGLDIDKNQVKLTNIDKLIVELVSTYNVLDDGYKIFEYDAVINPNEIWEEIISAELTSYSPEFLESEFKDVILNNNVSSLNEYLRTSRKGRGKPISRRQRSEIWNYFEKFKEQKITKHLYYKDEVFNAVYSFLTENNITPYDFCIVDELQDFSNVELRLVRSLVKEKPNDFIYGWGPNAGNL